MTNATLERAAKALEDAHIECARASGNPIEGGEDYVAMARAVLMAVRTLDDENKQRGSVIYCEGKSGLFTAMIDAILNDGEGE